MSNKIVLRVKDVDNCPLYHVGERMVLAPPEVLKLNSDRICALALAKLFPFALEYLCGLQAGETKDQVRVDQGRTVSGI